MHACSRILKLNLPFLFDFVKVKVGDRLTPSSKVGHLNISFSLDERIVPLHCIEAQNTSELVIGGGK